MNRNSSLAMFVIIAFVGIAVFGLFAMGNQSMNNMTGHSSCIAAVGQSALCSHDGPLSAIEFHSQFFQRMTSAGSNADAFVLLAALLALAFLSWLAIDAGPSLRKFILNTTTRSKAANIFALSHQPLLAWLTVRQRGDAVSA